MIKYVYRLTITIRIWCIWSARCRSPEPLRSWDEHQPSEINSTITYAVCGTEQRHTLWHQTEFSVYFMRVVVSLVWIGDLINNMCLLHCCHFTRAGHTREGNNQTMDTVVWAGWFTYYMAPILPPLVDKSPLSDLYCGPYGVISAPTGEYFRPRLAVLWRFAHCDVHPMHATIFSGAWVKYSIQSVSWYVA